MASFGLKQSEQLRCIAVDRKSLAHFYASGARQFFAKMGIKQNLIERVSELRGAARRHKQSVAIGLDKFRNSGNGCRNNGYSARHGFQQYRGNAVAITSRSNNTRQREQSGTPVCLTNELLRLRSKELHAIS